MSRRFMARSGRCARRRRCCQSGCRAPGVTMTPHSPRTRPRRPKGDRGAREAARVRRSRLHAPEVHLLSNGNYHVIGLAGRRRLQPVARSRDHAAGARTPRATRGDVRLPPRSRLGTLLVGRASAGAEQARPLRGDLRPGAARSTAAAITRSRPTPSWCVSPEDDVEIRRVTLTNLSWRPRTSRSRATRRWCWRR